ncbi:hypothetical protein PsorP6_015723 [Peronosclerospora sorghi]|uniref:Uncharacterized protein n=1 Tax=Peronosclerospora sorghi TaxID=230839 RepID=A0ACC0WNV0_9STRA|nr:hypothetical protein PsorP6_015723 [Peronosclerospora sorghi]
MAKSMHSSCPSDDTKAELDTAKAELLSLDEYFTSHREKAKFDRDANVVARISSDPRPRLTLKWPYRTFAARMEKRPQMPEKWLPSIVHTGGRYTNPHRTISETPFPCDVTTQ